MSIEEIECAKVTALNPFERYNYFIKKIVDNEELWCLQDSEGDFALSGIDDHTVFSLWSDIKFAEACLIDEWKDFKPVKINLDEFNDVILPQINDSEYLIEVFPIPNKTGFVVTHDEFVKDISAEMKKYD